MKMFNPRLQYLNREMSNCRLQCLNREMSHCRCQSLTVKMSSRTLQCLKEWVSSWCFLLLLFFFFFVVVVFCFCFYLFGFLCVFFGGFFGLFSIENKNEILVTFIGSSNRLNSSKLTGSKRQKLTRKRRYSLIKDFCPTPDPARSERT